MDAKIKELLWHCEMIRADLHKMSPTGNAEGYAYRQRLLQEYTDKIEWLRKRT